MNKENGKIARYNEELDDIIKKFLIDGKIEDFICIDSHLGTSMTRSMIKSMIV